MPVKLNTIAIMLTHNEHACVHLFINTLVPSDYYVKILRLSKFILIAKQLNSIALFHSSVVQYPAFSCHLPFSSF